MTAAVPVALLALALGQPPAGPADPVRAALDAARAAHATALDRARREFLADLDAREDDARRRGDKGAVDAVNADRDGFVATGSLPRTAAARTYEGRVRQARQDLLAAYAEAVRGYTRARKDGPAAAAEEEMRRFAAGNPPGPDARTLWVAKGGRRFAQAGGKKWTETAPDGAQAHYVEVDRTVDFVELRKTDGGFIRLHAGVFYWGGLSPAGRSRVWTENLPAEEGRGGWVR